MANMEQVQIVKRGRDAVARWREEHQGESFDLHAAYLSYARLAQVDLHGSDLRDSDLMGATLPRANLVGMPAESLSHVPGRPAASEPEPVVAERRQPQGGQLTEGRPVRVGYGPGGPLGRQSVGGQPAGDQSLPDEPDRRQLYRCGPDRRRVAPVGIDPCDFGRGNPRQRRFLRGHFQRCGLVRHQVRGQHRWLHGVPEL